MHDDYALSLLGHFVAAWGINANRLIVRGERCDDRESVCTMLSVWMAKASELYGITAQSAKEICQDAGVRQAFHRNSEKLRPKIHAGKTWLATHPAQASEALAGVPAGPQITPELARAHDSLGDAEKPFADWVIAKNACLNSGWVTRAINEMRRQRDGS